MFSSKLLFAGSLLLVGVFLRGSYPASLRYSLSTLDEDKKAVLNEFRDMVQELHFPQEYMKDDAYLLRYLAFQDFNMEETLNRLKLQLAAREAEKVDSVLDEDWSDYEKRFPYDVSGVNKEGHPILYVPYGKWDISGEVVSGDIQRFTRYASIKLLEEVDRKAHSLRKENNDIATFDVILNLDGYTLERHGCLQCLEFKREILKLGDLLFKEGSNKGYTINAPFVFRAIHPWLAGFLMDEKTRQKIKLLAGSSSFEPILLQEIDREQMPKEIFAEKY